MSVGKVWYKWILLISMLGIFACVKQDIVKAAEYSGMTGNIQYEFRDGTLYLYSEEKNAVMPNYAGIVKTPWENWKSNIQTVVINTYISNIGEYAFENCENLKSVEVKGNDLRNVGDYAFNNCIRLKSIVLPEGVTEIGMCAFTNCMSLESSEESMWTFPSTLKKIGFAAFERCTQLKYLVLPSSLQYVERFAFFGCNFLEQVKIKDTGKLISFPENVFDGCETVEIYVHQNGYLWNNWINKTKLKPIYILAEDNSVYEFFLNGKEKCEMKYTGQAICPVVEVRKNGILLTQNKDYTVSYKNNSEVGKGKVIITGIHQYEGICRLEFDIVKKDNIVADDNSETKTDVTKATENSEVPKNKADTIDTEKNTKERKNIRQCNIKVIKSCDFTGEKVKPKVKIYYKSTLLKKEKDYTVTYSDNIAIGKKAKIVIKGKGQYTGTKTRYFSIIMPKPIIKVQVQKNKQVKIQLKNYPKNSKIYVYYKAEKDENWLTPRVYKNKKIIRLIGKKSAKGKVKIRVRYVWKKQKSRYSKINEVML